MVKRKKKIQKNKKKDFFFIVLDLEEESICLMYFQFCLLKVGKHAAANHRFVGAI